MTEGERRFDVGELIERIAAVPDIKLGTQIAAGVLALLVFVGIIYPAPAPVLFLGIVFGALTSLIAMGLVLIYRANRIVNFAQGDLGGVASVLAASLMVGSHWNFFLAAIVGLVAAIALGAYIEFSTIRRFAKAPRLILTVVTIGLQQVLAGTQLVIPKLFHFDIAPQPPQPFNFHWNWFPVTFNGGHLLVMIVVPIVVIALSAFFRFTDIGIAVRAQAESADRAALLGIPTKRIGTIVWMMAAGMSGLAVILRIPISGVQIGQVLGPSLMLSALAAAVIGGMESLPVTFGTSLVLGMFGQAVFFATGRSIITDAVMFAVIIIGLLFVRRPKISRADDTGASTWASIREVRPIPKELKGLPEVRYTLIGGAVAVAAFLLVIPNFMSDGTVNLFGVGLIFSMIILSLVILTGWSGQISLGQMAFVGFGAAVAGSLAVQGKDFFLTLVVAGLVGAGIAIAIGIPALRIRGLFLAVTTLAFAQTAGTYFLNQEFFPWLVPSDSTRILRPTALLNKFNLESEHTFYYFLLLMAALILAAMWSLRHSRTGRALVALRDNTRGAQSYGINRIRGELTAFGLAGFIAALAGALFVYHQHQMLASPLETTNNLKIFSIAVIGGLGSIPGALFGAAYQTFVEHSPFTRVPASQYFASGAGLMFILFVFPSGFGGLIYDIRDRLLRVIARRRDIVVPSLLADVRVLEEGDEGTALTQVVHRKSRREVPEGALLAVDGIDVSYGKTQVLFDVHFHVEPGEIVALLGTNGAGKSTLLNAIAGLAGKGEGKITFDGEDITKDGPNGTVAKGIVLMPGARGVFPTLTVEENLRLAAWLFRNDPEYVKAATDQVLEYFPVLRERWKQKAGNLSGGEQQMLTLSQVFIAKPKLLMIDELSIGLAPVIVERLLDIVRAIHAQGTAIVLVEQSVNIAITLAERAAFLEKGEVRFEGPTADLLDRPDILRAVFLKGPATRAASGVKKHPFEVRCEHCGREHDVALDVRELSVSFGGIQAVTDVSFDVREGQIIGVIGANGAGKTTVFDLISGFVQTTGGSIRLMGQDVTALGPDGRARLGLGRSFQDARLFPAMTVRQAIATALERHIKVADPISAFVLSPAVRESERAVAEEVDRLIELLNLQAFADKFVGELSTGTRRIVDIACSLAHDPKVLLLDEPSSGLAQRETEALAPVMFDIRDQTGAALIVVEHDIPLVTTVADELVALELGTVIARGEPKKVINDPAVVSGYLGSSDVAITRSGARKGKAKARPRSRANGRRPKPKTTTGRKTAARKR